MVRRLTVASLLVAVTMIMSACGSDDSSTGSSRAMGATEAADSGTGKYCEEASAYLTATQSIDAGEVTSILHGLDRAATTARAVADVAPAQVRTAHQRLAAAAEELVAGLRARAPRTRDELDTANQELVAELSAKYGNLERETHEAQAFATKECALSFD